MSDRIEDSDSGEPSWLPIGAKPEVSNGRLIRSTTLSLTGCGGHADYLFLQTVLAVLIHRYAATQEARIALDGSRGVIRRYEFSDGATTESLISSSSIIAAAGDQSPHATICSSPGRARELSSRTDLLIELGGF